MNQFKTFSQWLEDTSGVTEEVFKERMMQDCFSRSYINQQWESVKEAYLYHIAQNINKLMDQLQTGEVNSIETIKEHDEKQANYTQTMKELFSYLKAEFGFNEDDFYDLQDTALLMD